tara:strand:- start:55 stop:576 length:522 start_codon:yes stop_codon:yes gene_type:complete
MASTLKVNTIAHSGGTNAITIDSTGRILTPARPAFSVKRNGNQGISNNSGTKIEWNEERFDIGGNFDHTTNYYFTAPITGIYQLQYNLRLENLDTAGAYVQVHIKKNNNVTLDTYTIDLNEEFTSDVDYTMATHASIYQLTANDTVYVEYSQSGGATQTQVQSESIFSGYLIG